MKKHTRIIAAALLLAIFAVFASLYLTGCATRTAGRETAALAGHLAAADSANTAARDDAAFIRSNLSRADGKAAVILRWLEQHRGQAEH